MDKQAISEIIEPFQDLGGLFLSDANELALRLNNIKAFIFDWDGVFNNGAKGVGAHSGFTEADSMGTNLLRFSRWLAADVLPKAVIITGANNESARAFGKREHFHAVYSGFKNKTEALDHLCQENSLNPAETCFFFDDVLDLSIASKAGLRMMINRSSSPLFKDFVARKGWADYVTACEGGSHGLREACEVLIGLGGQFSTILEHRLEYSPPYQSYLQDRQAVETKMIEWKP